MLASIGVDTAKTWPSEVWTHMQTAQTSSGDAQRERRLRPGPVRAVPRRGERGEAPSLGARGRRGERREAPVQLREPRRQPALRGEVVRQVHRPAGHDVVALRLRGH